jgi:hypothetical protein
VLGLGIACLISAAAWVYLVAAHGGFWLTSQRLPPGSQPGQVPSEKTWPAVALLRAETRWERVIVPAFVYLFAQLYPFRKARPHRRPRLTW